MYGFLDNEHIVHHVIHIVLGLIIRGKCGPAFTAAILMAQETSGIFLNYFLLMRYRAPSHWSVLGAQALFALAFFIWRLGLGTWGTLAYWRDFPPAPSAYSHNLAITLGVALVLATVLQWYWGIFIVRSVKRALTPSDKPGRNRDSAYAEFSKAS